MTTQPVDVEAVFAAMRKLLADAPIYDLATLKAVHDYFEFEWTDTVTFDAWLHAHIIKAIGVKVPKHKTPGSDPAR